MQLRLTIDVTYAPNGVSEQELSAILRYIADYAADRGLITGETPAEVVSYETTVSVLGNPVYLHTDRSGRGYDSKMTAEEVLRWAEEQYPAEDGVEDELVTELRDWLDCAEVCQSHDFDNANTFTRIE